MESRHGGVVALKPINEVAIFMKNLVPANIPETYALKPVIENIASTENVYKGVIAFRDFIYLLCDCLISDGHTYAKPPNKPAHAADYPFLYYLTNLLVDVGYHSKFAENGDSLTLTGIPILCPSTDRNGKRTNSKIPVSGRIDCFRFLALCGFVFKGVDLEAKSFNISEEQPLIVSYPDNPIMLTGLKAMSVADMELRATRRYWNDNHLLRCDYRLIMAEDTDALDALKDILHPLPGNLRDFVIKLHQRYIGMGLTCVTIIDDQYHFAYSDIQNSKRVYKPRDIYTVRIWEFSYSLKHGYCIFVRSKKTAKYAEVIKQFPQSLQENITKGYGCDRKLRNERCQKGCQGIRVPVDESILEIGDDIVTWLDNEISC